MMTFFQSSKQVVQKTGREDNRQTENLFQHTVSMVKSERDGSPKELLSCNFLHSHSISLRRVLTGSMGLAI